jgi:hypothetical protein
MPTAIQPTPLADALPGMVLAEVLRDPRGNVLLAEGVVLTESMLASLARHGVAILPILCAAAPAAPPDSVLVQARLDRLFRSGRPDAPASAASAALRRHVESYRLQAAPGTPS